MEPCLTCKILTKTYRCSKCLKFTCSHPCYKKHKIDNKCELPAVEEQFDEPLPMYYEEKEAQRLRMFTTDDTVDSAKLEQLEHSERLKELLHNPHLRDYLRQVDTNPDAWKAMKMAMFEPLFVEFADECLKVVEPDDELPAQQMSPKDEMVQNMCSAIVAQIDE